MAVLKEASSWTAYLPRVDLDLVFEDNQKQNSGSSIDNSHNRIRDEKYVYSHNIVNSNSISVPYSEDRNSSYYENFKNSLSRLKSGLYSLFSSSNSTKIPPLSVPNEIDNSNVPNQLENGNPILHRSKRQDEEDSEEANNGDKPDDPEENEPDENEPDENDPDENDDDEEPESNNGNASDPTARHNNIDDEDGDDLARGSGEQGSGAVSTEEPTNQPVYISPPVFPNYDISPGTKHVYRLTLIIGEPYTSEYLDKNSRKFRQVEDGLADGLIDMLRDLPGHRTTIVQGIHRRPEDSFTSKVTLDLETINYYDNATLESRIRKQISEFNRIGDISVFKDGFTFRDFRASTESCLPEEIQCRSNYVCLPTDNRCNGVSECFDESDEADCPKTEPPTLTSTPGEDSYPRSEFSSTPNGTIEEIPIVVLKNLGVESSYPNPDRCEEQVQCADSDIMICVTQQCDGTNDCPLADDEENCLYKKDCTKDEFMCDVTRCIPKSQFCNGVADCSDETDELNCVQPPSGLPGSVCTHRVSGMPDQLYLSGLPDSEWLA
ncbi:hypothetical protein M8J77_002666 [Diaphorina citri]|nr:hypothetical protein M8J77_002666 [Diaphorina citri]